MRTRSSWTGFAARAAPVMACAHGIAVAQDEDAAVLQAEIAVAESGQSVSPAAAVQAVAEAKLAEAQKRAEEIAIDLSVFAEAEDTASKLQAARLSAELKRLESEVEDWSATARLSAEAAGHLKSCDESAMRETFGRMNSAAEQARAAVASYRTDRDRGIARIEAQAPAAQPTGVLSSEVESFLAERLDAMDETRRSEFLALTYGVANELGVKVIDARRPEASPRDYIAALHRTPRADLQMAMLAMVAYENRHRHRTGGTILGAPLEELAARSAISSAGGRAYRVSPETADAALTGMIRRIWGTPEIQITTWDLSSGARTAAAFDRLAADEYGAPDPGLLAALSELRAVVARHDRSAAIVQEQSRLHADALAHAKRHDLVMERAAGAVFQADSLQKRQNERLASITAGRSFFAEEAARLASSGAKPRVEEMKRLCAALADAAISLRRARHLADTLAQS